MNAKNRANILVGIEVINSNPNGDPANSGEPRITPDGFGVITNGSIKRKIRDILYAQGKKIFLVPNALLDEIFPKVKNQKEFLDYFDVRMFGNPTASKKAGHLRSVRGAMQVSDAYSQNPIEILNNTITASFRDTAEVNAGDKKRKGKKDENDKESEVKTVSRNQRMGNKSLVKYGFYLCEINYDPFLNQANGITDEDLESFIEALKNIYEVGISSIRNGVHVREIIIFSHPSELGVQPKHKIFGEVTPIYTKGLFDHFEINKKGIDPRIEIMDIK